MEKNGFASQEKALSIKPSLGEALANLAMIYMSYNHNFTLAKETFLKAIKANPNHPTTYHWYSILLCNIGKNAEAVAIAEQAFALDPASPVIEFNLSMCHFQNNNLNKTITMSKEVLSDYPGFPWSVYILSMSHTLQGQHQEAIDTFNKHKPDFSQQSYLYEAYCAACYNSGQEKKAYQALIELMTKSNHNYIQKEVISNICFFLGMEKEGFYWLDKAYEERSPTLILFKPLVPKKNLKDPKYLKVVNQIKGWVPWSYERDE